MRVRSPSPALVLVPAPVSAPVSAPVPPPVPAAVLVTFAFESEEIAIDASAGVAAAASARNDAISTARMEGRSHVASLNVHREIHPASPGRDEIEHATLGLRIGCTRRGRNVDKHIAKHRPVRIRLGIGEGCCKIRAHANDENALALLGDTILICVQHFVIHHILTAIREELQDTRKRCSALMRREPLHVLHQEDLGHTFEHETIEVQDQLPARILETTPLSCLRERLTGNPAHQNIHAPGIVGEMEGLHVSADDRDIRMVVAEGRTAGGINLIEEQRRKPGLDEPRSKTSSTSTNFDKGTRHYDTGAAAV